jgi:transcriptional regulator with XRE-family HTH domain
MLSIETVHQILNLLQKGLSKNQIAKRADVSVTSVTKVVNGLHPLMVCSEQSIVLGLALKHDDYVRYLIEREELERQIEAGLRTPMSAINGIIKPSRKVRRNANEQR